MNRFLAFLVLFLLAALPAHAQANRSYAVTTTQISVVPNTGAYGAGNCLGGVLTANDMFRSQGPGGTVVAGVTFLDPAHQTAANDAMSILVFNAQPTGTYTDHSGCAIASADRPFYVGTIAIAAANCVQDSGPATTICTVTPNLPVTAGTLPVANNSLWFVPVVAATPTYGTTTLLFNFVAQPN